MKRIKFIYNPFSGENIIAEFLDTIIEIHQSYGYYVDLYRLNFEEKEEDNLANALCETQYAHILIAGGDGTINYIVNFLKHRNIDIPIALLSTGTANDFARALNIPNDIKKACHSTLKGSFKQIDLGLVNDRYFVNVFSCGLFTDVSQKTPAMLKNTFGKLAYYVGGIGDLPKFKKINLKIESDGGNYDGSCLIFFVFNGKTAGQLNIAPNSLLDDGKLDVLIFKNDTLFEFIETVFHYLAIFLKQKKYPRGVVHIRCTKLTALSSDIENTDIDGQEGPDFPLDIKCMAESIKILLPN